MALPAYEQPMGTVTYFNYLRHPLTAMDNECTAVTVKLQKAQRSWYLFYRMIYRKGSKPKISGRFYLVVVQAILLFWIGDMGGDPTDGPNPGDFPPQGGKKAAGDSTTDTDG